MFSTDDHRYMARAIQLAYRGLYTTDPNPRVGCVIVNEGEVVGEGWHERTGEPHAEIHALGEAGDRARGATVYVTLEPCSHHGRTPPCSDALISAGVGRVIVAMPDPNPRVGGSGLKQLQAEGIETVSGLMDADAEALNPGFLMRMRTGRPFVRCKLAMSLDGRTAMASGESRWITGPDARRDVHRLRARSSAIMTGIETVLADDPSLTARLDDPDVDVDVQPMRVILDSRLRMPPSAKMLDLPGSTLVCTASGDPELHSRLQGAGAEIAVVPEDERGVSIEAVLHLLADREVNEVHVEAGAGLAGSLVESQLVDELVIYMAPHLMGDSARGLFSLPWLEKMQNRINLNIQAIRAVGKDWKIVATVRSPGET